MAKIDSDVVALEEISQELEIVRNELIIHREAKSTEETCKQLIAHSEQVEECFAVNGSKNLNPWHKSEGGGSGCTLL